MRELFSQARRGQLEAGLDPEALKAARDGSGRTLLHVCDHPDTLGHLLDLGLDPNVRDVSGQTPLMRTRQAECNRLLLASGADLSALDSAGNTVLAHQTGSLIHSIGYCAPDFQALDVLVEAGITPPTPVQLETWIADARGQVTAAIEHNDACAFEDWMRRNFSSGSAESARPEACPDSSGSV